MAQDYIATAQAGLVMAQVKTASAQVSKVYIANAPLPTQSSTCKFAKHLTYLLIKTCSIVMLNVLLFPYMNPVNLSRATISLASKSLLPRLSTRICRQFLLCSGNPVIEVCFLLFLSLWAERLFVRRHFGIALITRQAYKTEEVEDFYLLKVSAVKKFNIYSGRDDNYGVD